jgi:quinoprotein glucose dehydrogenase
MIRRLLVIGLCVTAAFAASKKPVSKGTPNGEWRYYSGDNGARKYSPLDQINAQSVSRLQVAWRRPALDASYGSVNFSNSYQTTPLMVDGVLYASNAIGLIEAFDPATGRTIWTQAQLAEPLPDPAPPAARPLPASGAPPAGPAPRPGGRSAPRGIAHWGSGGDARLFIVRGRALYAVDARSGKAAAGFGDSGKVDLSNLGPLTGYYWLSPPVVCRDVVIVGSASSDNARTKKERPGDVTAYDVRTGKLRWTFHVIPRPGEFGIDTWKDDSWSYTGSANVWAPFSADDELGYVYLPTSTPNADWFGGHRPGNGLFGESLVCVEAATGKRIWHFQLVHHGLWDYDLPAAPVLGDITVNGKRIKAVMQVTKQAFLFTFDRVTGQPVWPIEERPVPQSDTPGEQASATQPFPTRPAAYDRQGMTLADAVDFTPEIHAQALEMLKRYTVGPLFTPPSVAVPEGNQGTVVIPGWAGGANWGGAAFDPVTGMLYVTSVTDASLEGLARLDASGDNVTFIRDKQISVPGPQGLPIMKPPYGRITAIDMNRGEHVWMVPNGDGPRNHPALIDLHLPPLGSSGRVAPLLTKTLLFVGEGDPVIVATPPLGGGKKFRAYDKNTGKVIWETEFPAGTTGAPMAYMYKGKQYIVVAIGGRDHPAEFVALALGAPPA